MKVGLERRTLAELDRARDLVVAAGYQVDEPRQSGQVWVCETTVPDLGVMAELLEREVIDES